MNYPQVFPATSESSQKRLSKPKESTGFYTVSVTSQGQISIPAKLRRKLGLHERKRAWVTLRDNRIIIEPLKDFLDQGGSLKTNIKANPRQEREAFGEYLAKEVVKRMK